MNNILYAATREKIEDAAYAFLAANVSIIPCAGKRPALAWEEFKYKRATPARVSFWLASGRLTNIGVVCGVVSGGLVVIDIDSREACIEFEQTFPALLDTLTVISGSQRGKHYYFYTHVMPSNTWRNGVELRSDGAYVIAPPSLHPGSGLAYCVDRPFAPKRVLTLEPVRQWILSRGGGSAPLPVPKRPMPSGGQPSHIKSKYGQAALLAECEAVGLASQGTANTQLYRSALKLGSLVAAGHLTQSEVETALESAASTLSARDGVNATRRTIASAFKVSLNSPRQVR